MDLSVILQTEIQCVQTQIIIIDLQTTSKIVSLLPEINELSSSFVDYIYCGDILSNYGEMPKTSYVSLRSSMINHVSHLRDKRFSQGTQGRLVIWFIGEITNSYSALFLKELPFDLANYFNWKYRFLPTFIRCSIYEDHMEDHDGSEIDSESFSRINLENFKSWLNDLSIQYFKIPKFEPDCTGNHLESDSRAFDDVLSFSKHRSNLLGLTDNTKTFFSLRSNQYDIILAAKTPFPFIKLITQLIPLHKCETNYVNEQWNADVGSGGSLYMLGKRFIFSVSPWRRIDWLAFSQTDYMPRLWILDRTSHYEELLNILDYRYWSLRFSNLDSTDSSSELLVSYPDSSATSIKKNQQVALNIRRRYRERNWNRLRLIKDFDQDIPKKAIFHNINNNTKKMNSNFHLSSSEEDDSIIDGRDQHNFSITESQQDSDSISSPKSKISSDNTIQNSNPSRTSPQWDILDSETNNYRISRLDAESWKSLIIASQRQGFFELSLDIINSFKTNLNDDSNHVDELFDPIFLKLEAMALFKIGSTSLARSYMQKYIQKLQEHLEKIRSKKVTEAIRVHDSNSCKRSLPRFQEYVSNIYNTDSAMYNTQFTYKNESELLCELATAHLANGDYEKSSSYALEALKINSELINAYKILIWASIKTEESSLEREVFIFSFFATRLCNIVQAQEYYDACTSRHPQSGFFWYGKAMFTFIIQGEFQNASSCFEKCVKLLPNEARVLESYATFLFQSGSEDFDKIFNTYFTAHKLNPDDIVTISNMCAFELYFTAVKLKELRLNCSKYFSKLKFPDCLICVHKLSPIKNDKEDLNSVFQTKKITDNEEFNRCFKRILKIFHNALLKLETVLYSNQLNDVHPQIFLECWFYMLCYAGDINKVEESLQNIKIAIMNRIRAPGWDFKVHILGLKTMLVLSSSEYPWVECLTEVINSKKSHTLLDKWERWNKIAVNNKTCIFKDAPAGPILDVSPPKESQKSEFALGNEKIKKPLFWNSDDNDEYKKSCNNKSDDFQKDLEIKILNYDQRISKLDNNYDQNNLNKSCEIRPINPILDERNGRKKNHKNLDDETLFINEHGVKSNEEFEFVKSKKKNKNLLKNGSSDDKYSKKSLLHGKKKVGGEQHTQQPLMIESQHHINEIQEESGAHNGSIKVKTFRESHQSCLKKRNFNSNDLKKFKDSSTHLKASNSSKYNKVKHSLLNDSSTSLSIKSKIVNLKTKDTLETVKDEFSFNECL